MIKINISNNFIPVELIAAKMEEVLMIKTGRSVRIKLPLETDKEKELFIKLMNIMGITL